MADNEQLETEYEAEVLTAVDTAVTKYGFEDAHFSEKLKTLGAMMTGMSVASKEVPSAMLLFMKEKGEPGLSIEAITVREKYSPLFPEEILALCRTKLADAGFVISPGW